MTKSKKNLIAGILILIIGLVTGAVVISRLVNVEYVQGMAMGSLTYEDGTPVTIVSIEVEGMEYTVYVPEKTWDGWAPYDKRDPSKTINVRNMYTQLFMLALPEAILGLTLVLTNRKAFSGEKSKDGADGS